MDSLIATSFEFTFGLIGAFFVWLFKGRKKRYWIIFKDHTILNIFVGVIFVLCILIPFYIF